MLLVQTSHRSLLDIEGLPGAATVKLYLDECNRAVAVDSNGSRIAGPSHDHASVLQAAIGYLRSGGDDIYSGSIYIERGIYNLDRPVVIPKKSMIRIVGSGVHSTILRFTGSYDSFDIRNAVILYMSDVRVYDKPFNLEGHIILDFSQHLHIENLAIDTRATRFVNGITAVNIDRLYLRNVRFKGYYSDRDEYPSSLVDGFAVYIDTTANNELHFDNVKVSGYYEAFKLRGDHVYCANCKVGKAYIGFELSAGAHKTIIHPESYLIVKWHYFFNSQFNERTTIIAPSIEGTNGSIAFHVNATKNIVHVFNPYIKEGSIQAITDTPDWIKIHDELHERSGVAIIPAGQTRTTVPHGLAAAPTTVLVTPLTQPPGRIWVENITETSFDIVTDTAPSEDLAVAWRAEAN